MSHLTWILVFVVECNLQTFWKSTEDLLFSNWVEIWHLLLTPKVKLLSISHILKWCNFVKQFPVSVVSCNVQSPNSIDLYKMTTNKMFSIENACDCSSYYGLPNATAFYTCLECEIKAVSENWKPILNCKPVREWNIFSR